MIVRGLNLIAPVIALPYILRIVGLENYGHVAFTAVIATFAGSVIQYGFSVTGVKAIASARNDADLLALTFWRNFFASMLIGIMVVAGHAVIMLSLPSFRAMWPLHLGAILLAAGNALVPHWLFLGLERSYYVAISTFIVRFSYLLLIVLFVRAPQDYVLINFLGAAVAWLNMVIALAIVSGMFKLAPSRVKLGHIVETIQDGFSPFLLQWTPNLYNSASIILLGFHVSPAALGAFNAANAVVTLVTSLGQLLANAFLPILSTSFAWHKVSSRLLIVTGLVLAVTIMLFAPVLAFLLAESGRDVITRDLFYLSLSIPFLFGYYAFGYNYVSLTDRRNQAGYSVLLISLAGLLLSFILVPPFASAGVGAVLFVARGSMFALSYAIYRNHSLST
jgi:PST family polysaccharide transporter